MKKLEVGDLVGYSARALKPRGYNYKPRLALLREKSVGIITRIDGLAQGPFIRSSAYWVHWLAAPAESDGWCTGTKITALTSS